MSLEVNKNKIGLEKKDYQGSKSTLCTGCGHDLISAHVITACYQAGVNPLFLTKMSGIGCSSKLTAYFMSRSFAVNSMHGRMAPVATGARLAQKNLKMLGVSGDGDSMSIGLGGFLHLLRRNVPMVYIIANNGVYGLTKGQFSPTADKNSELKTGAKNLFESLDVCATALQAGATFVARTFSGDQKQMVPLIQAALHHHGTAVIDVISPCITFNNHETSTKSYDYVKSHDVVLQEIGVIFEQEPQRVDYDEGDTCFIKLDDTTQLKLRKLNSKNHDVKSAEDAAKILHDSQKNGELLTGLFYVNENEPNLIDRMNLTEKPLNALTQSELKPSPEEFQTIFNSFN